MRGVAVKCPELFFFKLQVCLQRRVNFEVDLWARNCLRERESVSVSVSVYVCACLVRWSNVTLKNPIVGSKLRLSSMQSFM
jgi:hypothetical protein